MRSIVGILGFLIFLVMVAQAVQFANGGAQRIQTLINRLP